MKSLHSRIINKCMGLRHYCLRYSAIRENGYRCKGFPIFYPYMKMTENHVIEQCE